MYDSVVALSLPPISRSRAAVARRAHNPKVGGSNPPFATKKPRKRLFYVVLFISGDTSAIEFDYLLNFFANGLGLHLLRYSMKSGFVNIFGKPNAGKSTLLNALMERSLAIVSSKVQTTRHRIKGISYKARRIPDCFFRYTGHY